MKNRKPKELDERYTQILLEKMGSDIKFVAEQHGTIVQKIDVMKEVQDRLVEDVAVIKSIVQSHSKEIKEIKTDTGMIKSDVTTLKADVTTLKSDVTTLKSDVTTLKSDVKRIEQKLDIHIEICDKRFQKIEEKVFI
ncbi:MAG: hypothetical protein AABZ57_01915 [Candidatus Margulisiibacteriota bacterium]